MNPNAVNPLLPPKGKKDPDLYVLGEAVTPKEDQIGTIFKDHPGRQLRGMLRGEEVRWNKVVRTVPPKDKLPTPTQTACFMPDLVADIEKAKPSVILACGSRAMRALIPNAPTGAIQPFRDTLIPTRIGDHRCWVLGTWDVDRIFRIKDFKKGMEKGGEKLPPGTEQFAYFEKDVDRAATLAVDPPELPPELTDLDGDLELLLSADDVVNALRAATAQPLTYLDAETSGLDPHEEGAKILTLSIGWDERTVAFPIHHSQHRWRPREWKRIEEALRRFFAAPTRKIAHNAVFDMEWLTMLLGPSLIFASKWGCSKAQSYTLDPRVGTKALDWRATVYFGIGLKAMSSDIDITNLDGEPLRKVLRYNALDVKVGLMVYREQNRRLVKEKLLKVYDYHVQRYVATVTSMRTGIPIDVEASHELDVEWKTNIDEAHERCVETPVVQTFVDKFGRTPNLGSDPDLEKIFRGIMGRKEVLQDDGKISTAKDIIEGIEDPFVDALLSWRKATKLHGTYIDKHVPGRKDSYIRLDGRVHPRFDAEKTGTGRLASEKPNAQNYPKRKAKFVRRMLAAPPGMTMLSSDYGQIEARILGMVSKDPVYCAALWDDYDLHLEWAEKLARRFPFLLSDRGGKMKDLRQDVKSLWSFALFYGSHEFSVANTLGVDPEAAMPLIDEFWDTFAVIRKWQKSNFRAYNRNGFVKGLTGRKRWGPLSYNQTINTPIQGTASDVTVDAMTKLALLAWERDMPHLAALVNIHDDLTFCVPTAQLEAHAEIIVDTMLDVNYPWVNVPISIELEVGPNLYEMDEIGKFSSSD